LKESEGKEAKEVTKAIEEKPLPYEGTSKTKTLVEKILYATLMELKKSNINVIKWKRMEGRNKGKYK
jgi:hypothetical protein